MKNEIKLLVFVIFLFQTSLCLSQNSINLVLLPDPVYQTHHIGVEAEVSKRSRTGILAAYKYGSSRPTYGKSNNHVTNNFSRVLIPWILTKRHIWEDGVFVSGVIGLENDRFKTSIGSKANSTFVNLVASAGYQWFWRNGFNISLSYGRALLIATNSSRNINANESGEIIAYLDKNTKSNNHGAIGFVFGVAF